ncbi:MAG: endonuclease III, partial [Clostridia bacterium]|nr:endonuclease III [Clostridia bacterium]MBQ9343271.1 endonuclease III [Clostridia bacterium]
MNKAQKDEILRLLAQTYPEAKPELNFSNPYETLVAVILSAQCTDKQVNKVTPAVFARYPDVAAMAKAEEDDLYPMVKSCGFKTKASNIIAACRIIMEKHGGEVPHTMEELTALPGVGRKTANVVMATAFGLPAIAVDTHVFRVSNRLGLAKADNVLDTEMQLRRAIPKENWSRAHHWLIWHGRRVCAARNPHCTECPLNGL